MKLESQRFSFAPLPQGEGTTGVFLGSMNEALIFNNYHEGLHFGYIQHLKNLVVG